MATTVVEISETPDKPTLSSNGPICRLDTLIILANTTDADQYFWNSPIGNDTTNVPMLEVPNLGIGTYTWSLIAAKDDCLSEESERITIDVEDMPDIEATNDGPICQGDALSLFIDFIAGASYQWEGPNGFDSDEQNPVTTISAGMYYVTVTTPAGCMAVDSTFALESAAPVIDTITSDAMNCVSGTEQVILSPIVSPPDNGTYTYVWSGPNGFQNNDKNPIISNITSADNGTYSLVVRNSIGCRSIPMDILINVSDIPPLPIIAPVQAICEYDQLVLNTGAYSGTSVEYFWIVPGGDTIMTSTPSLQVDSVVIMDQGNYNVFVVVDGCSSNLSSPINVSVNSIPSTPTISGDTVYCEGESIVLNTPSTAGFSYEWIGPRGQNNGNTLVYTDARSADSGTYFLTRSRDGCTSTVAEIKYNRKRKTRDTNNC